MTPEEIINAVLNYEGNGRYCSTPDCFREAQSKTMCTTHYASAYHYLRANGLELKRAHVYELRQKTDSRLADARAALWGKITIERAD